LRIYVAGAYTPTDCTLHDAIAISSRNVEKAIEVGIELIRKGHVVYVPHLSHYIHMNRNCPLDVKWYEFDNSFIEHWANALYFVSSSKGADAELELAKKKGLKIFYKLEDVPEVEMERMHNRKGHN
jgi:hypothetical protein